MTIETIPKPAGTGAAFPKAEVQAKLRELLLAAAQADAALKGITLPSDAAGQLSASIQLDSLEVVSLLCDIEPIVMFELKDSFVRSGGYPSIQQAMEHLMPRIEKAWQKHGSKK
jgi:hypothetical protein